MKDSQYDDLQPPASLTPVDRQQLILLHKVLEHLDVDEADYHRRMSEVLTQGFTLEYESVLSPYAELPRSDCRLVMDVLDMFRVIKASLAKLDSAERDPLVAEYEFVLRFQGFDGNDAREGKMGSYVTYLQSTGRWSDLQEDVDAADGGNSHSLMLDRGTWPCWRCTGPSGRRPSAAPAAARDATTSSTSSSCGRSLKPECTDTRRPGARDAGSC